MPDPTPQQVLAVPMGESADAVGAATLRDYLIRLLTDLWAQGSTFNAHRPFGGTAWQWVVYEQLVKAGLVKGKLDGDSYVKEADISHADRLIAAAIQALGAS